MKTIIYIAMASSLSIFTLSCSNHRRAKNYNKTTVDNIDLNFIKNGMEEELTEIKASGIVKTHSKNPKVIGFANMITNNHTTTVEGLKRIESDNQIDEKDSINNSDKQRIDSISKLSGANFDKAYMHIMIDDHRKAIRLFYAASQDINDHIQKFARKTLPVLQMHLDSAKLINAGLK